MAASRLQAPVLQVNIPSHFTAERLLRLAPILAVIATALAATHLPVADALTLLERLAHSNSRRALRLVGAVELEKRDIDPAKRLELLGPSHPARAILEHQHASPPPRAAPDDLGEVTVHEYVARFLGDRLHPHPALYPQDQRQGRTLHPDGAARMGNAQAFPNSDRRAQELPIWQHSLQLA